MSNPPNRIHKILPRSFGETKVGEKLWICGKGETRYSKQQLSAAGDEVQRNSKLSLKQMRSCVTITWGSKKRHESDPLPPKPHAS